MSATRILILGGTSSATALAHALADRSEIAATLSLAGRTSNPLAQPLETRIGGFGGIDGLAAYLVAQRVAILVDATHPFAVQMSRHARAAGERVGCQLIVVGRPPWVPVAGDDWHEVDDMAAAAAAIGPVPRRVFLTVGRLQLAAFSRQPQHRYLVRTIDPVEVGLLRDATFFAAQGPFDVAKEEQLLRDHRIEMLITKNSGGDAAIAKLVAARRLGLPVILVRRPDCSDYVGVDEALAAIDAHRNSGRRAP